MSCFKRMQRGQESRFYYYKFRDGDGRQRFVCTKTAVLEEAEARERLAKKAVITGKWDAVKDLILSRRDGNAALSKVLVVYRARGSALEDTIEHNINQLALLCKPSFPERPMEELTANQLTAAVVRAFKAARIAGKGQDKLEIERAKRTANSIYSQARSVFSKQMLAHYQDAKLDINEKQIQEFKGVPLFEVGVQQYQRPGSEILVRILTAAFRGGGDAKPLKETDPNAYRAFLLALGLGLRKNGAAHARWNWIGEQRSQPIAELMVAVLAGPTAVAPIAAGVKGQRVLQVRIESDFQPKGRDEQTIPMDDFVHSELMELQPVDAKPADYILAGHLTERVDWVWRRLADWMRALGWDRRLAAHELRKLFGAEIACAFGLYAAQKLLGHKDANLTSARYADMTNLPKVSIFGR